MKTPLICVTLMLTQVLALDHSVHLMEDDSVEILVNALVYTLY